MSQSAAQQRARTKIIATVGPACSTAVRLEELVHAGVDVFRLNMAHGSRNDHDQAVAAVRAVSNKLAIPIAILIDLAGPKIRLGEIPGGALELNAGQQITFISGREPATADELSTTYEPLIRELAVGSTIFLADGAVALKVTDKGEDFARCNVVQGGTVRSRQGLNLPGVKLSAPAMDEDDRDNVAWGARAGVDFIGLSFVRAASDLRELKRLIKSHQSAARVIAKIEKQEALEDLDEIVRAADGVMVARGDLGVEIEVARMPIVQKHIVNVCHAQHRPAIIATQMLDSMQNSSRPTRADVTDVANAILDGGDACMLSGETAVGKYPRQAVEMMNQIALATEELFRDAPPRPSEAAFPEGLHPVTAAVTYGAGHIAARLHARLIVVASHTGATALALANQRTYVPTVGVSDSEATLRQMCLYWGVFPLANAPIANSSDLLAYVTRYGLANGYLQPRDWIVLVSGTGLTVGSHNTVMVHRVES